jgi:[protein-PII] uridylyltransferase
MAPYSDVDLLFLTPYKITGWAESVIESMLYILWDLHLKVGHASRTVKDCLRLAREDYTIRTSLLETRYLDGDRALADDLQKRLWNEVFKGTGSDFIEAKLQERLERHEKQGGQRYVVEPNVKEGKGGLRDLQTLFWIAKYIYRVTDASDLVTKGMLTREEYDSFLAAEAFLMAVRCHLHLISERAVDQLTFDLQVAVAERLGYRDHSGRRGVEHFMQDYFRHATQVGELTRIFLTGLEAKHVKKAPSLVGLFRRRRQVKPGYSIVQNRLAIESEKAFLSDKLNLLRIFEEALRTGYLIHPDAMRLISANLGMIDDEMRASPEANRIFLDLMLKHGNPERALRRMNELGVLAAFLPEFAPIVAMMQFNMYHHYTVDEHTIQCIKTLAQIERGELVEELPVASRILKNGVNRRVLYVALLLHDIGKGRPEDHSVLGAQIARRVAPRLGLKREECETVEWLVRYHLLMSDMAQKRDIADPRTVRDFAKAVRTTKRLDLLTVLTVCDIRGVGPGVWNNWKAQLLRSLYRMTWNALDTGLEAVNRETREDEAKRELREALADWQAKEIRAEIARHYGPYWQGMPTEAHVVFARLLHGIGSDEVRIDLLLDEDRDATRICFALADHPGIFSRLAGALALVGANVVDARTYTSKDGWATAVFWVQDADGHPFEASRHDRLRAMIGRTLKGEVIASKALVGRDKLKKRERAFTVNTSITFDNDGSEIYTIIEVDTRDRPGLLYDLTKTLADANVYIASAVIATFGEQVVDSFYVKDMFGLKFHSVQKQKQLEKKLREAIAKGSERAQA